jgi:hypothetical protein
LRKNVILSGLGVQIVQECDSKWVMGGVLRSNWAWAVILGKSLGSSELQDQSNRAWEHMFGRTG